MKVSSLTSVNSNVSRHLEKIKVFQPKSEKVVLSMEYPPYSMNSLKHYTDKKYINLILKPNDYIEDSTAFKSGNWTVELSSVKDKLGKLFASESIVRVKGDDGVVRKAVEKEVTDVNGKVHKSVSCHTSKMAKPAVSSK